ncbi:MAG: transporter substrate-binding domain-containing protein [Colwellia sp.]|nr:transporter substrate-binding domain-containing protein [Colwellia sp.]
MLKPILGIDKRSRYKDEVLLRALDISKQHYGPFTLEYINVDMTTNRALISISTDKLINLFIAPASKKWEKGTIPIKVPIRLGLLSYRLLLINKNNLDKFNKVESLTDLKKLTAGLQSGWTTTDIFNEHNIKSIIGHSFEGLFLMLDKNRFDYFPRAIYEAYDELENRKHTLTDIVVEPTIALYIPMPTYVYVSSSEPQIAKRLEFGLQKMATNGELKAILNMYYKEDIARANLQQRKIIEIKNPYIDDQDIFKYSELLIKP